MSAFWQKNKINNLLDMNVVTVQFMALQKYLWMFKTQYQTLPMNFMKRKVQYIHILI